MLPNRIKKTVSVAILAVMCILAQAQPVSGTVTARFDGVPLKAVLDEIQSQTGYTFACRLSDLSSSPLVRATFKNAAVETVLKKVLPGELSYSLNGKMVSITKNERKHTLQDASPHGNVQSEPVVIVKIKGVVNDPDGPAIGVAVIPQGDLSNGIVTDYDGKFEISVPAGTVLEFTSVGFKKQTYLAQADSSIEIELHPDSEILEEVVVVGYGVQKKESVVGAISQISTEAIVNSGTTNISNSLAGKLSGVQTYQTSGQPGAGSDAKIYIRGLSSWNNDEPLVMVDGVERSFSDLDPNEVATISVLKDASATAVFGAKGANGVILVTTKTGMKGKAKMKLSVDFGLESPTNLPVFVPGYKVIEMSNLGFRNDGMFASQFSDNEIEAYREHSNPMRYPDNDWYGMFVKNLAKSLNSNYTISGGGDKVRYFVSIGYTKEGSIINTNHDMMKNNFSFDKINYRSNLDINLTGSTTLSIKVGGNLSITGRPSTTSVVGLFNNMYQSSGVMYPGYYPTWFMEQTPDPDYPGDIRNRIAHNSQAFASNPYHLLAQEAFTETSTNRLNTDLALNQKLDFITKGLSANAKIAYTTQYSRNSRVTNHGYPYYEFDWVAYDLGDSPWLSTRDNSVYEIAPYAEFQENDARDISAILYWEGGVNYSRDFGEHSVTGQALFNQRQYVSNVDFPRRTESMVGRVTYNYKSRYFFEGNVGYTGSEQFSPLNRFGLFPSAAVGYTISKEKFWKQAMPWWSKMKLRYSDGLVGSDSASARWLYISSFLNDEGFYVEGTAANETARWETARKRDLGFEMGWFDDALTLDVDLFHEHRTDMIVAPVVTPLVGIDFKDVNTGELKKHGYEAELKYRKTTSRGFYYELGGMFSFNENRILFYEDLPYSPSYQKYAGTAYGAQRLGLDMIDGGFFNTVDDIHLYKTYSADWTYVHPGIYKYGDYNSDGDITTDDRHPISGSTTPLYVYSFNLGFGYKSWSFSCLFYGNAAKYTEFSGCYETEFYKANYIIHASQVDYWTPTNNAQNVHRNLTFDSNFGSSAIDGHSWRRSDYLSFKEVYLGYKFDGEMLQKKLGVDGLTITLTGNNIFTFTNLIEGDPQLTSLDSSYYPIMRVVKLGVKLDF